MRNILLAAVSAVALLGVSPEVNAVAAARFVVPMSPSGQPLFSPMAYTYEGMNYWYTPYGRYWLIGHHARIEGVEPWFYRDNGDHAYYWYVVDKNPTVKGGLFYTPVQSWHTMILAPHVLDHVLDMEVRSPYTETSTDQTTVK